ncbi:hypothetical protein [Effusibacillus pohliae]|uniref:hypothetical protein n=1 Tax=Effusibacillus pohliae TaxID=232270 RepID=UPI00036CE8F4|nr:hypothetical protein [Effusibacillus pohliae]
MRRFGKIYGQSIPAYGFERRGASLQAFVKLDENGASGHRCMTPKYQVEIEATAHAWRMPFVWLFEKLFRAEDAVRLG